MKLHSSQQKNVSVEQMQADSQSRNFSGNTGDDYTEIPASSNRFYTSLPVKNPCSLKLLRLREKVCVYILEVFFFLVLKLVLESSCDGVSYIQSLIFSPSYDLQICKWKMNSCLVHLAAEFYFILLLWMTQKNILVLTQWPHTVGRHINGNCPDVRGIWTERDNCIPHQVSFWSLFNIHSD